MANVTLTDEDPAIAKVAGGGGKDSASLTDAAPLVAKAAGGGGRQAASLVDTIPAIKAGVGGGREQILLYDPPPTLTESRAQAGLNPLFKGMLDDD